MMNLYGNYLPSKKSVNRILLKSLLGVFAGGVLFSLFFLIADIFDHLFASQQDTGYFPYGFLSLGSTIFIGVTLWTLLFAAVPAMLGGILLSGIIYRDLKFGTASRNKSIVTGLVLAGVVGLSVSVIVAFTVFRPSDVLSALRFAIPVTSIVSLIGTWGGTQVYKEINSEFLNDREMKEKS